MKALLKNNFTLHCALLLLLVLATATTKGYAQFHGAVDVKYSLGLREENFPLKYFESHILNTNSLGLAVSGFYEISPEYWVGAGLNTNINNRSITIVGESSTSQVPIMQFAPYITFRYRSIKHLNLYLFTDLGYAIPFKTIDGIQTFSEGVMWNAGIGYNFMLTQHFGLNFSVGYNLQQIKGTPCEEEAPGGNRHDIAENNLRHSINFTVGIAF